MTGTKRFCKRDGFPLVKIGDRWECAGEYLNRCIGGEKIVDLVQKRSTFYYVFESGHQFPLLCSCCNSPLVVDNLEESRQRMRERCLKSMAMALTISQDGKETLTFLLEFSGKGLLWRRRIAEPISPQAAAQMRHPNDCPHKPGRRRSKRGK